MTENRNCGDIPATPDTSKDIAYAIMRGPSKKGMGLHA